MHCCVSTEEKRRRDALSLSGPGSQLSQSTIGPVSTSLLESLKFTLPFPSPVYTPSHIWAHASSLLDPCWVSYSPFGVPEAYNPGHIWPYLTHGMLCLCCSLLIRVVSTGLLQASLRAGPHLFLRCLFSTQVFRHRR